MIAAAMAFALLPLWLLQKQSSIYCRPLTALRNPKTANSKLLVVNVAVENQ